MPIGQDGRRRNNATGYFFALDDFGELIRAAKNSQAGHGASCFPRIIVEKTYRPIFNTRIFTALPDDDLSPIVGPVDQHRDFLPLCPSHEQGKQSKRKTTAGYTKKKQEAVNDKDDSRVAVEPVN